VSEGEPHEVSLTSAGITNTSIHDALVDLLGKPIAGFSVWGAKTLFTPPVRPICRQNEFDTWARSRGG
jgi:hypothetical protein